MRVIGRIGRAEKFLTRIIRIISTMAIGTILVRVVGTLVQLRLRLMMSVGMERLSRKLWRFWMRPGQTCAIVLIIQARV